MAAGAVSVPTIVPLRAPHSGQHKTAVDTRTKIELHSGNYSVDSVHVVSLCRDLFRIRVTLNRHNCSSVIYGFKQNMNYWDLM